MFWVILPKGSSQRVILSQNTGWNSTLTKQIKPLKRFSKNNFTRFSWDKHFAKSSHNIFATLSSVLWNAHNTWLEIVSYKVEKKHKEKISDNGQASFGQSQPSKMDNPPGRALFSRNFGFGCQDFCMSIKVWSLYCIEGIQFQLFKASFSTYGVLLAVCVLRAYVFNKNSWMQLVVAWMNTMVIRNITLDDHIAPYSITRWPIIFILFNFFKIKAL